MTIDLLSGAEDIATLRTTLNELIRQINALDDGANIILDTLVASTDQAKIEFHDAGVQKWELGKNTDNSFFIYDNNNSAYVMQVTTTGGIQFGEGGGKIVYVPGLILAGATPASAGATGTTGTITWDADFIYVCTATNTWKKVAIATW